MKLLHVSDTHGGLPILKDRPVADLIVHTGDLFPNRTFGQKEIEPAFQQQWLEERIAKFRAWFGSTPTLLVPGNHDYFDAAPALKEAGMNVTTVVDRAHEFRGLTFWGHPWTPEFCGWNWMASPDFRREKLAGAVQLMDEGRLDVLLSHGPMFGVLDRNREGERCGSRVLREVLQQARFLPKAMLCGHIHESNGLLGWSRGMIVSNAACGQRLLDVS